VIKEYKNPKQTNIFVWTENRQNHI